jgi:hypothetical protein
MSVREIVERLAAIRAGEPLDWNRLRTEIVEEHARATSTEDRVTLLAVHKVLMDTVERGIRSEDLESFKTTRRKEYCLFLIRETVRPDHNVDPQKLQEVTAREIKAGRMAPDDDLRELAVAGAAILTPIGSKPTLGSRFSRWFGK